MTHTYDALQTIENYISNYNYLCYFDSQCVLHQFVEMEDYDSCIAIRDEMKSMRQTLPLLNTIQQEDLISIEEMSFTIIELIQHYHNNDKKNITTTHTPQLKVIHAMIKDHPFVLTREWDHRQAKQVFTIEKMSDCQCEINLLKLIPSLFDKAILLIEKQCKNGSHSN